jgi:SWI/SNF-related matrix-associated actin-dependent regulator of chromatin subfamily D
MTSDIVNAANVLGIKEESRLGVIQALWNYIKVQSLQDKVDRRVIRADEYLRPVRVFNHTALLSRLTLESKIFSADSLMFQRIPELVNRYLMAPDPIILHYTVDPAVAPPERPSAWDVEVKTEDGAMKSRMTNVMQTSKESAQELTKLDEEVRNTSLLL